MNNGFANLEAALESIKDPLTGAGLVSAGRIQGLSLDENGAAVFTLEAPAEAVKRYGAVRDAAEAAARKTKGVKRVTAVLTAHQAPAKPRGEGARPEPPAGVKSVIAVASAKGGVGKSTLAVNLACAFAGLGLKTGLLDVDVYGPSAPTMLGLAGRKPEVRADKKLVPMSAYGLQAMSIGFLVDPDMPMIWRGPMATSAVRQMLDEVAWDAAGAPLDLLVLDMPPGTGDIQLTIAQRLALAGAVIISTPQEVALADVRRGAAMFDKTHTPVIGVIENMAYFEPIPGAGRHYIFGEGGARRTAEAIGAPFLGALPIDVALRESADAGRPLVAADPASPTALLFKAFAEQALANMAAAQKTPPTIRFV